MNTARIYSIVKLERTTEEEGLALDGNIILNSNNEVGDKTSNIVNSRVYSTNTANRISDNEVGEFNVQNIKIEPGLPESMVNRSSGFNNLNVVTDLVGKIKEERDDETEVPYESENNFCTSSNVIRDTFFPVIKTEKHREETEGSKCANDNIGNYFDGPGPSWSVSITSPSDATKKSSFKPETKEIDRSAEHLKFVNVSVMLKDLFSKDARKLGKAHSDDEFCACIYCENNSKHSRNLKTGRITSYKELSKTSDLSVQRILRSSKLNKECPRKYRGKTDLNIHESLNRDKKPFKISPTTSEKDSLLKIHVKRAFTGDRPFRCKLCSKSFKQLNHAKEHVIFVHNDERPYECERCASTFKQKKHLKKHMQVHNARMPFECKYCSCAFKYKYMLGNHMLIHGEKNHSDSPVSSHSANEATNKELRFKPKTQNTVPFSKDLKFLNVSVLLEDLFSKEARRLGKAHSNNGLCVCIYCKDNSEHYSRKTEGKISSTCQKFPKTLAGIPEMQSSSKVYLYKEYPRKCRPRVDLDIHKRLVRNGKPSNCKLSRVTAMKNSSLEIHIKRVYTGNRPFSCKLCCKTFKRRDHVKEHIRCVHSDQRPFKCELCSVGFKLKRRLDRHRTLHSRSFKCNLCPVTFKGSNALKKHEKCKHKKERLLRRKPLNISKNLNRREKPQKLRKQSYQSPRPLKAHSAARNIAFLSSSKERIEEVDRQFNCLQCSETFLAKTSLEVHLKALHTKKTPSTLKKSSVKFKSESCLNSHLNLFSDERPFKCKLCFFAFKRKGTLNEHMRTHSKERPFKCKRCSYTFKFKRNLNNHMWTHSAEKPFKCELCSSAFIRKRALNDHMRTHSAENTFKCKICSKAFKFKRNLNDHIRTHRAGMSFKCELCSKVFSYKRNLCDHMWRTHSAENTFKCRICSKAFKLKRNLNYHIRAHRAGMPFKCELCAMAFKRKYHLQRHLLTHSEKKLLKCNKC